MKVEDLTLLNDVLTAHRNKRDATAQLDGITQTYNRLVKSAEQLGYSFSEKDGELLINEPKEDKK